MPHTPHEMPLRIVSGAGNVYLADGGSGYILIDAGSRRSVLPLSAALRRIGASPHDIRLIVVTHVHYDHVAGLRAIKEISGAPVLAHRAEVPLLEHGKLTVPPGISIAGKVVANLTAIGMSLVERVARLDACAVDLPVDAETSLAPHGIAGTIIPTPGHTAGSLTLLTPNGDAFVGDLCHGVSSPATGSALPLFGENVEQMYESWRKLLQAGARTIFPGHGRAMDASVLQMKLEERERGRRAAEERG